MTIRTSINWRLNAICSAEQVERIFREERGRIAAGLIRRSGSSDLAEEALQDVFISIWQQAGQFTAVRGRPMAWMMSIARYRAIDHLRRERYAPTLVAELVRR